MDSRPILKNLEKVNIFIDSKTFDNLLKQNNRTAIAILKHKGFEYLEFVRSPLITPYELLNMIPQYEWELTKSEISSIKIQNGGLDSIYRFGYKITQITEIAKKIYSKNSILQEELDDIISVFVQAIFNTPEKSNIYITNNKSILKKRLWFESNFPGCHLNIMSLEEASLFLDLVFKKKGKYHIILPNVYLNKGLYYWVSTRSKLSYYNVGDPLIDALANRFYYILMALDEIGIQYYSGTNNDTMDNALYHFNYLITLITGIFDNLALKTNEYLGIKFIDLRKVSIYGGSGHEFLKEIRLRNKNIRDLIQGHAEFINLIYSFRELIIHREGLSKTGFENKSIDGNWKANFIKINNKIKQKLKLCKDKASDYDPFTIWGFYELHDEYLLDPYHFSLESIKRLTEFIEKYLKLLGYTPFIKTTNKEEDFIKWLNLFEQYHLGI